MSALTAADVASYLAAEIASGEEFRCNIPGRTWQSRYNGEIGFDLPGGGYAVFFRDAGELDYCAFFRTTDGKRWGLLDDLYDPDEPLELLDDDERELLERLLEQAR